MSGLLLLAVFGLVGVVCYALLPIANALDPPTAWQRAPRDEK